MSSVSTQYHPTILINRNIKPYPALLEKPSALKRNTERVREVRTSMLPNPQRKAALKRWLREPVPGARLSAAGPASTDEHHTTAFLRTTAFLHTTAEERPLSQILQLPLKPMTRKESYLPSPSTKQPHRGAGPTSDPILTLLLFYLS